MVNEYHWGDFKGDPHKLVRQYSDAFLYFANWGTHELMFRLPWGYLDPEGVEPYCVEYRVAVKPAGEHLVLDFVSPEECYEDEWRDWRLGDLLPLRADLLAGDLRCLYLAWLSAVQYGDVDDDAVEPPVPAGLQRLSGPLTQFAEFLYLSPDLIDVAAEASPPKSKEPDLTGLPAWIATLQTAAKDRALLRVLEGEGTAVVNELLLQYRRAHQPTAVVEAEPSRRTAAALRGQIEARRREREQREAQRAAQAQIRQQRKQAAARAAHLDSLRGKEATLWQQVDQLVLTKQPKKYDEAVTLLKDLHELGRRDTGLDFCQPLRELLQRHSGKPSFQERVKRAGLAAAEENPVTKRR